MESSDLLKKEEEFRRQNALIEEERKKLFETVDDVMKTQELFLKEPVYTKQSVNKSDMQMIKDSNGFNTTASDLNLPKSADDMGTKGMLHFYKAKLKATQNDFEKVQSELKNKSEELKKVLRDIQTISEEKEKWFLQYTSEKNNNCKMEKQISAHITKLQVKDNDNLVLKKEVEQLKSDLKNTQNELHLMEERFTRTSQECEKIKSAFKQAKQEEKETKLAHKEEIKESTKNVKTLQKHKSEILQAFKRQAILIDNLKKQKELLESIKMSEVAEADFGKILTWKMKD